MGDFPPEWPRIRDLKPGGQGEIFVVRRSDQSDPQEYVLKRLKNSDRIDRFEQEIETYKTLNHPNILKLIDDGWTPKPRRYLITEFCAEGSLDSQDKFERPLDGLRFFGKILSAIAYVHARTPPTYHLDLKPENILLKNSEPLVGDFGICYIENEKLQLTTDGPHGSIYYCAPEFRGPKRIENTPIAAADVYSLGKILYWLFTKEVYDGHEDDYAEPERSLAPLCPSFPQFAFIDDLIQKSVRRRPVDRFANAVEFHKEIRKVMEKIEAGGRVLDLDVPQRCLYCADGFYHPAHDEIPGLHSPYRAKPYFPQLEFRQGSHDNPPDRSVYSALRDAMDRVFRMNNNHGNYTGIPLTLICDHCGNIQYFRLDLTRDKIGLHWKP